MRFRLLKFPVMIIAVGSIEKDTEFRSDWVVWDLV